VELTPNSTGPSGERTDECRPAEVDEVPSGEEGARPHQPAPAAGAIDDWRRLVESPDFKKALQAEVKRWTRPCRSSYDEDDLAQACVVSIALEFKRKEYDLQLMFTLNDVGGIPTKGKNRIIVADVSDVLHFRIFDGRGKTVADKDEKLLAAQESLIKDFRQELEKLRPPHELTTGEKSHVTSSVTSIVGHTQRKKGIGYEPGRSLRAFLRCVIRRIFFKIARDEGRRQFANLDSEAKLPDPRSAARALGRNDAAEDVREAMSALPLEQSDLLWLRAEYRPCEISEMTGEAVKVLYRKLEDAKEALRKLLGD
jgi:hypothetical protein